jgi:DNA-nicking Smr family endonuclease
MTGVASYYISQAREQTQLMKEANRQAYESLCRIRMNQFRQTHRLDLHELHADEALQLFKQVEQELGEGNRRTTPKSIEIITGYGKNSPYGGGSGKIRSVIISYLRQRNYK